MNPNLGPGTKNALWAPKNTDWGAWGTGVARFDFSQKRRAKFSCCVGLLLGPSCLPWCGAGASPSGCGCTENQKKTYIFQHFQTGACIMAKVTVHSRSDLHRGSPLCSRIAFFSVRAVKIAILLQRGTSDQEFIVKWTHTCEPC